MQNILKDQKMTQARRDKMNSEPRKTRWYEKVKAGPLCVCCAKEEKFVFPPKKSLFCRECLDKINKRSRETYKKIKRIIARSK